jgi:2-oxoglutarate dehydrogenase E2 component (dihydrolipoamide succinyltransferase)
MAKFDLIMPKLGESIIEATITKWLKAEGDSVDEDDAIVEIATDKVDSEIPSPIEGKISKLLYEEGDVVAVGEVIAHLEMEDEDGADEPTETKAEKAEVVQEKPVQQEATKTETIVSKNEASNDFSSSDRFYSPLVKSIAKKEGIGIRDLDSIQGSGKEGRVTKADILDYLKDKTNVPATKTIAAPTVYASSGDQIVEMDRMRKLIADHMVMSKQVSPHVTSFIDVDVTNVVNWRNKAKDILLKREGEKITFTPIFIDAAAKAIKDFPGINASVDGTKIILRKDVNIGMAAALPNGNLIVPVIKHADEKNLLGLSKNVNDLANRARNNKLLPDEIQGGTFTVTNFGSFDSLTGTPIINQPQVAILGIGAIRKKPVVIETPNGDVIGIRSIMIFSLAYDHRVVDGALAGMYLKRLKELLENFDVNLTI